MSIPFDRIAILGTGLIGTSLALALKTAKPSVQISGYDASGENLRRASQIKAIDRRGSLGDLLADAEVAIVATPVGAMPALFEEMAPVLKPQTIVVDTGSTKAQVLAWAERLLPPGASFVGGHPMAGKTESGPDAADAKLFQGAVWCVVPSPATPKQAIDQVVKLVEGVGAAPYFLDAEEHDGLVAAVSHLPYLMSVALIGHLGGEGSWRETASLAAGGFAYTTHLTDSDPRMFADIARTNRDNIVRRLDLYMQELTSLRDAIADDQPDVKARFERARTLHVDWLSGRAQGQASSSSSEENNNLPSTKSMLTGSLFGRLGSKDKDKEK